MLNDIFSSGWTDIVFAGRNQNYGAYQLRQLSNKAVLIACFISTGIFTGAASYSAYMAKDVTMIKKTPPVITVILPPPPPPPVKPPVETIKPPAGSSTPQPPRITTAPPVIVADTMDITSLPPAPEPAPGEPEHLPTGTGTGTGTDNFGNNGDGNTIMVSKPTNFHVVQQMPVFKGGQDDLMRYIATNTVYPAIAKENDIEGTVYISFVVNEVGNVVDVDLVRGVDRYLDKEALRVIKSLPTWKPGKQNGEAVRVMFTLPIRFRLD